MEKALWYLLVGTRGGANRARILRALDERPRNANELGEALDLEYNTIRYHLEKLCEHDVLEPGDEAYGQRYFLTERMENHRDTLERILEQVDP